MAKINADEAIEYGTTLVNAGVAAKRCGLTEFDLAEAARPDVQEAMEQWAKDKASPPPPAKD
jgi:hypothetical protein